MPYTAASARGRYRPSSLYRLTSSDDAEMGATIAGSGTLASSTAMPAQLPEMTTLLNPRVGASVKSFESRNHAEIAADPPTLTPVPERY